MTAQAFNAAVYVGKIKRHPAPDSLGLYARYDLPEDADQALIMARLAKLPDTWRMKQREIQCFETFLAEHEEKKKILSNPALRESHRQRACADRLALLAPLREAAELWSFRGCIDNQTRSALRAQYLGQGFSGDDVDRILAQFPDLPPVPLADRGVGIEIKECLAVLKQTLLQALSKAAACEISTTSSLNEWNRAVAELQGAYANLPATEPTKNAGTRLYQRLFAEMQSAEGPRRILNCLGALAVEPMLKTVFGPLGDEKRLQLVERVRAAGSPEPEALVHQLLRGTVAKSEAQLDEERRTQAARALQQRGNRQLVAAIDALTAVVAVAPNLDVGGRPSEKLLEEMHEQLARLELKSAEARRCESTDPDHAYDIYQELLIEASDFEVAQKGLTRCRPSPPRDLHASVQGASIHLEWRPSVSRGEINYRLVRQEGSTPTGPDGGKMLAEGSKLAGEDLAAESGRHYYYAAFARRHGQWSLACAVGPITRCAEVEGFALTPGDGMVQGTWKTPPPSSKRVHVHRFENNLAGRWEGGVELLVSGNSFVDRNLQNGRVYYYRLAVEYRDASNKPVLSRGVMESACPTQPPIAVELQSIVMRGNEVVVCFTPPSRGEVRIFRLADAREFVSSRSAPLSAREVDRLGVQLQEVRPGEARDPSPPAALMVYVPVTLAGDLAAIGAPRSFVAVPSAMELMAIDRGQYIEMSWTWPPECRLGLLVWRTDRYPSGPDDPGAERRSIGRSDYEGLGCRIEGAPQKPHYFAVFCGLHVDGKPIFSSTVGEANRAEVRVRPQIEVQYEVTRSFLRRRLLIRLRAEQEIPELPELIVAAREDGLQPTLSNPGIILYTIHGLRLLARKTQSVSVNLGETRLPAFVRLLLRDPVAAGSVVLKDPAQLVIS